MRTGRVVFAAVLTGGLFAGVYAGGITLLRRAHVVHPRTGAPVVVPGPDGGGALLHNGWRITPAGRPIETGDMLLGGVLGPDNNTLAIVNCGFQSHALHLIDVAAEKEIARIPLDHAWNGVAWAPDGRRVYVSGGVANPYADVYVIEKGGDGAWQKGKSLRFSGADKDKRSASGLALSSDGSTLFVLNNADGHLYVLDAARGEGKARIPVGDHPIVCRLAPSGRRLYVANMGGSEVAVVDVHDPSTPRVTARIKTGAHPNDIALDRGRLFVSCGNSDSVSVFDVATDDADQFRPSETIKTSLTPKSPPGSTPNAVALGADGKTLYVANADNNCVCVVDVSSPGKSRIKGFIPTGWYPTDVIATADGKKVILASGKGTGSRPNPAKTPINPDAPSGFQYIGTQLNGLVSFVDAPSDSQLADYTRQVYSNTPYKDALLKSVPWVTKTAIPTRVGDSSPIKYVLYIIMENRTYDQVFGDIPRGNGDPNLCLFGRDVTPNRHALADQFVLLDNLYCNGEVSQDGHPWSTMAYCPDFTQRNWILSYSGKGKTFGSTSVEDGPSGFLWEACARKGLSFRDYGEFSRHPSVKGNESERYAGKVGPGDAPPGRDTERADIFIEEFKEFERTHNIPRFMVMSLGEDHTRGTSPGAFTPKAMVASNDQALGKIVSAISHSSVWNQFAIFAIEDDAQNGPDHVDSHRTFGLVISPYVTRNALDSTMYSTVSMERTIELILGLPPLTQYDAAATPMFACFTDKPDLTAYDLQTARIDLNAKNTRTAYGAARSAKMDWSGYDRAPDNELNRILWHSIKGANVPMPPPVRRAVLAPPGHSSVSAASRDNDE